MPQEPEASLHHTLRPHYAAAASEKEGGTQVLAELLPSYVLVPEGQGSL